MNGSFISYSATITALRGVFRSLHHHPYLPSASLLGQATQKNSTKAERISINAYREEELKSSDNTQIRGLVEEQSRGT